MTKKDKTDVNMAWLSKQRKQGLETPTCDPEKYREHVQEFDLSPEEEAELLQILWSIMAAFVEMGFGVDSIQFLSVSEQEQGTTPVSDTDDQDEQLKPNGGIHDD